MATNEVIVLKRDCQAIQIPSGHVNTLSVGTEVAITQTLGGYTISARGGLYRIAPHDADALGFKKPAAAAKAGGAGAADVKVFEQQVWEALKNCYDPEIPVNIVDLGLIYDMRTAPAPQGGWRVDVKMTLTARGCGMGPVIAADARQKLLALAGVADATVEVVWDPPWNPGMMSPEGKKRLGMG
ncbi:MAG: iron-sulfur cluster assembly protein [Verrucomicrobiia bacterium]|jgi:probable FeS assembly SUF system protein SufT